MFTLLAKYVCSEAQCLYVLTDDNYPAILDVRTDASYISCLLSIARHLNANADPRTVTLSVLATGEGYYKPSMLLKPLTSVSRNLAQCRSDTPTV